MSNTTPDEELLNHRWEIVDDTAKSRKIEALIEPYLKSHQPQPTGKTVGDPSSSHHENGKPTLADSPPLDDAAVTAFMEGLGFTYSTQYSADHPYYRDMGNRNMFVREDEAAFWYGTVRQREVEVRLNEIQEHSDQWRVWKDDTVMVELDDVINWYDVRLEELRKLKEEPNDEQRN